MFIEYAFYVCKLSVGNKLIVIRYSILGISSLFGKLVTFRRTGIFLSKLTYSFRASLHKFPFKHIVEIQNKMISIQKRNLLMFGMPLEEFLD